jgi:PD-(D/E)XK nuclease family transposase
MRPTASSLSSCSPPEQRPPVAELTLSIVDVKCTDARGVTYVVEMQVLQVEGFEEHVVYNIATAYVNQIARGELYPDLNDAVGITICDFDLWPGDGERRIPMLSRWQMTEPQAGSRELGQIRLVFLELPKYDTSRPPQTGLEKWAYFFREADNLSVWRRCWQSTRSSTRSMRHARRASRRRSGRRISSRGSRSGTSGARSPSPEARRAARTRTGPQRRTRRQIATRGRGPLPPPWHRADRRATTRARRPRCGRARSAARTASRAQALDMR